MEPYRVPEDEPADRQAIEEILREASVNLRLSSDPSRFKRPPDPGAPAPDAPAPGPPAAEPRAAAGPASPVRSAAGADLRPRIKYEVIERRPESWVDPSRTQWIELTRARIVAAVMGVVVGLLWVRVFLGQSDVAAAPADRAYAEASARMALMVTSQRVDEFMHEFHRTPSSLQELGPPGSELISYERVSYDRYRLTAPSPSGPLVLDSIRSRRDFLARTLDVLRGSEDGNR